MQLYFAYGSNLLRSQMRNRCPDHQFYCLASLPNYCFLIGERGFATIKPSVGNCVHGVIYQLSETDESNLDKREGVDSGCYTKNFITLISQGKFITRVLVYIDPRIQSGLPQVHYMKKIISGASEFNLPADYQKFLAGFLGSQK